MEKNFSTLAPQFHPLCTYMVAMLNFGPTSDQETGMVIILFLNNLSHMMKDQSTYLIHNINISLPK